MQRAEKLGIISELAASLAHEIRNPLTVVRGFLQMAGSATDEKNKQYMHTAISELDRAVFIISDYLNFAKPQAETITVLDASRELQDAVGLMSSYAVLHGVTIQVQVEGGLRVRANQDKFKQAVIHLLKNSIEASCAQGALVELRAYREEQRILVEIKDSGEGMTPEEVERLGEPFYSTREKGNGLGTMVTFRIVESMDGQLTYASQKGIGTQAIMQLPAIEQDTPLNELAQPE
jgi:two-component system sporulation sensor kinase B